MELAIFIDNSPAQFVPSSWNSPVVDGSSKVLYVHLFPVPIAQKKIQKILDENKEDHVVFL